MVQGVSKKEEKQSAERQVGISVKKNDDFSEWFTQLIEQAELADTRYNIKGFPVYRWWAVKSIKKMYAITEQILERKGHKPLIFPALIPESNFKLEGEHVKGFTPEVFWVTEHGDGEKFEERYALRPTSETAMYQMYSYWIRSHRDLPFKGYQSCQVWRCEGKATRPFFRTRELHWIEAHDVFATEADAKKQVIEDMETTKETLYDQFGIPFIFFQRPEWDKFAGAVHTYAADALMPSGRVMQLPSTHLLGQNFSKPFNVKFKNEAGNEEYGYITCYGPCMSRNYGAIIALHGDDKGLVLPWQIAPVHIVIVPIFNDDSKKKVMDKVKQIQELLKSYDVLVDDSDNRPGWKFNQWEMKGVPVRLELGQKDIDAKVVTVFRRDLGKKEAIAEKDLLAYIMSVEKTFTKNLLAKLEKEFKGNTVEAKTVAEAKKAIEGNKMVKANFCSINKDGAKCAEVIEKEMGAFVRGRRFGETEKATGKCLVCNKPAKEVVYIARSY